MGIQYQIPQVAHVVAEFASEYKKEFEEWNKWGSNSLVVVAVKNEEKLFEFKEKLVKENHKFVEFVEPDIGYSLTAIALIPMDNSKKLCSGLPLAGKPSKEPLNLKLIFDTVDKMISIEQTKGVSVLDHGLQVHHSLFSYVIPKLKNEPVKENFPLPSWFEPNREFILSKLPSEYKLTKYTVFHDIGKPFCFETDEEGKPHFPNHAEYSFQKYLELFPNEKEVAELIRNDMIIHTLKDVGVENFSKNKNCTTHLVVGLAEIYANSKMFGGFESESFKIKFKQLERRGKAILSSLIEKK